MGGEYICIQTPMKFQENFRTLVTELLVLKSLINVVAAERQADSCCVFL